MPGYQGIDCATGKFGSSMLMSSEFSTLCHIVKVIHNIKINKHIILIGVSYNKLEIKCLEYLYHISIFILNI